MGLWPSGPPSPAAAKQSPLASAAASLRRWEPRSCRLRAPKARLHTSLLSLRLQGWLQGSALVCGGGGAQTSLCWGLLVASTTAIIAPPGCAHGGGRSLSVSSTHQEPSPGTKHAAHWLGLPPPWNTQQPSAIGGCPPQPMGPCSKDT